MLFNTVLEARITSATMVETGATTSRVTEGCEDWTLKTIAISCTHAVCLCLCATCPVKPFPFTRVFRKWWTTQTTEFDPKFIWTTFDCYACYLSCYVSAYVSRFCCAHPYTNYKSYALTSLMLTPTNST